MIVKRKAFAYITSRTEDPTAARLLVFEHVEVPAAGIQVPAGTIEPGETPAAAALREAFEETGLAGLRLGALLGVRQRDMREVGLNEVHERHFFHLYFAGASPTSWPHDECHANDGSGPIRFRCFWVLLPDGVPGLIGGQGELLPWLLNSLAADSHDSLPAANPP